MRRSSSEWSEAVKARNGKLKEQLLSLLKLDVDAVVMEGMNEYLKIGTRLLLELLLEAEARQKCGKRYERNGARECVRWGQEEGTAEYDGAKRGITRPRVRKADNVNGKQGEVQLSSYKAMNSGELLERDIVAKILAGVSNRRYGTLVSDRLEAKGVGKSAISRKAIAATKPTVEQFRQRRLDELDLLVLLFDGIHVAQRQMIVCIGIDMNGRKHVLGLRTGATENEIVCRDLIRDLVDRGVSPEKKYLFVIDGSKALATSIRAQFGQDVAIQRCQEHKIRNVQAYLPKNKRAELRQKLQAAYNETSEKEAWNRLTKIRDGLGRISQNAVAAMTEGLYETTTVHRLGITGLLRAALRTSNIIESAFSSVRRYMGRVTKFKDEAQIELWVTRSILEAERHFRTVPGHRQLKALREKLQTYKGHVLTRR